jgi:hypothetical protein
MKTSHAALASVLVLASVVGACSAASRIGALQPPSEATSVAAKALPAKFIRVARPPIQLGVGVDFYTYPGQDVLGAAEKTVSYLKSLHANAISISFPYFMRGEHASAVYASDVTPSPAELAQVASVAEKAGLYVSLRPLLDEFRIGKSRTDWKPDNPAKWFASYERFLLPYAEMAQQTNIPELIDGTEFSLFGHSRLWSGLVRALRMVYAGTVAYDSNWGIPIRNSGGRGVVEGVDAYQPMAVSANAPQGRLTAAWTAYDRTLPRGTVELELDIAAVRGAYLRPYQVSGWHEAKLAPYIQVRWFTAACDALVRAKLGGIYYWAVGLGQSTSTPPTLSEPGSWVDSPGATAIAACFKRIRTR